MENELRYAHRESVLDTARRAVLEERNSAYGEPSADFTRSAEIASILLEHKITAGQIAKIMIAVKLSRLTHSPDHFDSWADIAGYASCGYEAEMLTAKPDISRGQHPTVGPSGFEASILKRPGDVITQEVIDYMKAHPGSFKRDIEDGYYEGEWQGQNEPLPFTK